MDRTNKQSKRFAFVFAVTTVSLLALIALFIYIVDPFFQYRVRDKQYILNPIYNNPGLAKNYDYNTAVIGSSMVQNYDLDILKRDGKTKPVKLASGAMTISEMIFLYSQTHKETETYIVSLDMVQFNEWMAPFRYPQYLFSGKFLDKVRYHFAYESVVRYGLTDVVLSPYIALTDEEDLAPKLKKRYSVENIGNFSLDAVYNNADRIKRMYRNGQTVSQPQQHEMSERMVGNINSMLDKMEIAKNTDKDYIFVLPPYSALYWHITKEGEYYDHMNYGLRYLCEKTATYPNVHIQFFYTLDQVTDLQRYSDVTHFDPETSNYILENIRNKEYTITSENIDIWLNELDSIVTQYEKDNADWL